MAIIILNHLQQSKCVVITTSETIVYSDNIHTNIMHRCNIFLTTNQENKVF